jgi:hypothetical protein
VAGSEHRVDEDTIALVRRMLGTGIDPVKIKAALGDEKKISLRWIYQLARKLKNAKHSG